MSAFLNPIQDPQRDPLSNAPGSPTVAYDARFSIGQYRGMGRYLRRLLRPIEGQAIGLVAKGESDPHLKLEARGFHFYPAWEQISVPRRVVQSGARIYLSPYNTAPLRLPSGVKLVLVIHDFIYLRTRSELALSRSAYQNLGRAYRRWNVPRAIRHADHIICVSETTRRELEQRFSVNGKKISVIPNTIDASWYTRSRTSNLVNYVFCVSGEAPNKNLEVAIRGFSDYLRSSKDRAMQMKIAGVKPAFHARFNALVAQQGIAGRIEFLPYVSDMQLQALYANARAFVFPSREEGFGIPVLEALACGTPVMAARSSAVSEVAGSAALYFNPDSPPGMAEQLNMLQKDAALQNTMSARGRQQAAQFHPDVVDAQIRGFWRRILSDE